MKAKLLYTGCCVCFVGLLVCAGPVQAGTLDDIKTNVKSNYNAIQDLSCTIDLDYTVSDTDRTAGERCDDYVDAEYKKKTGGKSRLQGAGADTRKTRCDGTYYYSSGFSEDGGAWYSVTVASIDSQRTDQARLMENQAALIDGNTWSLAGGTYTVNSVTCYKITCTNWTMYVDTSTKTKVMRIDYVGGEETDYITYSGYSLIDSTAYVPDAFEHYFASDSTIAQMSSISINDSLSDSLFTEP